MNSKYDQPDAPDDSAYDDKPVDAADAPQDGESHEEARMRNYRMTKLPDNASSLPVPAPYLTQGDYSVSVKVEPMAPSLLDGMDAETFVAGVADMYRQTLRAAIDPAENACHCIIDAFTTLQMELAKASTTDRAFALRRMVQGLEVQIAAVADAAAQKVEDFTR